MSTQTPVLPDELLSQIARNYFAHEGDQERVKNAIHDAFQTAGALAATVTPEHSPCLATRNEALEDAALACEAWGNEKVAKWADDPEMLVDAKARAWDSLQCAEAVRKLKRSSD